MPGVTAVNENAAARSTPRRLGAITPDVKVTLDAGGVEAISVPLALSPSNRSL